MRIFFLPWFVLSCCFAAKAQDTVKFKPHYAGMFFSGAQVGCTNCSLSNKITFTAQAINGIQVSKRFFTGFGMGVDTYDQWKTIPIFINISEKIVGKKNGLLFQFSSGYAAGYMDKLGYDPSNFKEQGGMMFHPSITYQVNYYNLKIYVSAGIKYQSVSYSTSYTFNDYSGARYSETKYTTDLRRAVFHIGFGWK